MRNQVKRAQNRFYASGGKSRRIGLPAFLSGIFDKRIILWISTLALSIVLIFIGYGLLQILHKKSGLDKELAEAKSKIKIIEQRDSQIAQILQDNSNENLLEKEARLKLNMQKPGEKTVIIINEEKTAEENAVEEKNGFLNLFGWLRKLIGR